MPVVVIGGDHYNTLWIIRSLGQAGISSYVILHSDTRHSFVAKSKYVKKYWIVADSADLATELLDRIDDIDGDRAVVYCTSDHASAMIDAGYDKLKHKFILFNAQNKQGGILNWMDKSNSNRVARQVGFNIPKSWSNVTSANIPEDITFPCIVKPLQSCNGSKLDFRICASKSELQAALQKLDNTVLVQEYITADYELSFPAARLTDGEVIIPGIIKKVNICDKVQSLGMVNNAYISDTLSQYIDIRCIEKYLEETQYEGLFSMDFLVSSDKIYFLETNFRTDGNTFIATTAGVNLPLLWYFSVQNLPTDKLHKQVQKDTYGIIETSYIKYINPLRPDIIIRDFIQADVFSVFSISDLRPFFYKIAYAVF